MSPRARSLLFFGITVVLAAVFARLGIWQLSRLGDRRAWNRAALAARALPPVSLDDPVAAGELRPGAIDNRRVTVTGRYDHAADIVLRGQTVGGVPGVRVVTPLRPLRGDTAILVQRGFVPSPDATAVDLDRLVEQGVQQVTGVAYQLSDSAVASDPREAGGRLTWRKVDLARLRERLPYPVAAYLVLQLPDSSVAAPLRRDQPPALDDGPHLSYAIQWFGFAVTALVVGAVVGFRRSDKVRSEK